MTPEQYVMVMMLPTLLGMTAFGVVLIYIVNRVHELEEVMSGDR